MDCLSRNGHYKREAGTGATHVAGGVVTALKSVFIKDPFCGTRRMLGMPRKIISGQ